MNAAPQRETEERRGRDWTGQQWAQVANLWPTGCTWPRMAVNAAQHKIVNLFKTWRDYFVIMCRSVFNVWPKTILLPGQPRDAKSLDTPDISLEDNKCLGKERCVFPPRKIQ